MSSIKGLAAAALASTAAFAVPADAAAHLGYHQLKVLGTYDTKQYVKDTAEQLAYDKNKQTLLVVNKDVKKVDVISIKDPTKPTRMQGLDLDSQVGAQELQGAAVAGNHLAIATVNNEETKNGKVALYTATGDSTRPVYTFKAAVEVGPHPESIAVSSNEKMLAVANEGSVDDKTMVDPKGSISLVDLSNPDAVKVDTIDFSAYAGKGAELNGKGDGLRVYDNPDPAYDLEPESVVFSPDDKYVFATLQDNNGLAVVDVANKRMEGVYGLGFVKLKGDLSNRPKSKTDPDIKDSWSGQTVMGMPQPDGLAVSMKNGAYYIFTADEGDARDYMKSCIPSNKDVEGEESRLGDVGHTAANSADFLKDEALGRLKITTCTPPVKLSGDKIDGQIYAYGSRGFSVFKFTPGKLEPVFRSTENDDTNFELILKDLVRTRNGKKTFNLDDESTAPFDRSDDKGAEPEPIVLGTVDNHDLIFVGLERQGGIMVFDVTDPEKPVFQDYLNNRNVCDESMEKVVEYEDDPSKNPAVPDAERVAGDVGPEGLAFIPSSQSPTGKPLLAVAHAVSGSTTMFEIVDSTCKRTDDGSTCTDAGAATFKAAPTCPAPPKATPSTPSGSPSTPSGTTAETKKSAAGRAGAMVAGAFAAITAMLW